jgi:hypothetical protein
MTNTSTITEMNPHRHVFTAEDAQKIAGVVPLLATTSGLVEECGDCCDSDCQGI